MDFDITIHEILLYYIHIIIHETTFVYNNLRLILSSYYYYYYSFRVYHNLWQYFDSYIRCLLKYNYHLLCTCNL